MKGLRFANSHESCLEAWKCSRMGCSALLCVRFYDSTESRFQASKCSNMGRAVVEGGRSVDIHEFTFHTAKRVDMDSVELKGIYMLTFSNGLFRSRKFKIIAVPFC